MQTLCARVADLQKDNILLKRAVQIQAAKLQERGALDAEVVQLRQLLAQQQEQLKALEMSNYSLSLHLARAASNSSMAPKHGPDVF